MTSDLIAQAMGERIQATRLQKDTTTWPKRLTRIGQWSIGGWALMQTKRLMFPKPLSRNKELSLRMLRWPDRIMQSGRHGYDLSILQAGG